MEMSTRRPTPQVFPPRAAVLRRSLVTVMFAGCLTIVAIAVFSAGVLDPGYATSGRVTTDFNGSYDAIYDMVLQSDGKPVVAGYAAVSGNYNFALARYNTNGTLDTTFGTAGKVTTNFTGNDLGHALVLQSDGKIVAAGGDDDFKLARYNTNGTLDTTFGTGGKVSTDFSSSFEWANALVLQPDGKIVVAGVVYNGSNYVFALARYNSNGTLDSTFGTGGKANLDRIGFASALVRQTDGKLVVAGSYGEVKLVRYNANGAVDTTFGVGGEVTFNFASASSGANALVLQTDGKLVIAGGSYSTNQTFALARLNSNGALDTTFGTGGKVTTSFGAGESANALALQADGKLVAVGGRYNGSNGSFALARYNSNGSLDSTFGIGGRVTTDFNDFGSDGGEAVVVQTDGKILAAGRSSSGFNASDFALARYADTNTAQTSFTISGQALDPEGFGLSGATVTLAGSASATRTTDSNGFYKFRGLARSGNYTITASKSISSNKNCSGTQGQVCFTPAQLSVTNLGQDVFTQDFVVFAPTVSIAGRITKNGVGVAGIAVETCVPIPGSGGSCTYTQATTNSTGDYTLANLPVLSYYTVRPQGTQFIYNPPDQSFGNLQDDVGGADFTAAEAITISGRLKNVNGRSLSNEEVDLNGTSFDYRFTDSNGFYSFTVGAGGDYTVSPSDSRVSQWLPDNARTFNALAQSVANQDFEAHFPSFTVGGVVKNSAGANLNGVNVRLTGTNIITKDYTTNSSGAYTSDQLNVLGDYTFTPQSGTVGGIGYSSFSPTNTIFTSIETCSTNCSGFDYLGINYVATASPGATTGTASSISTTTATLNGTVNPNGVATNGWFEWGTDSTLTTKTTTASQAKGSGTTNQAISQALSSLVAGSTYYFRTVGSSAGGTVKGAIVPFTTTAPPRTLTIASSNPASGVSITVTQVDLNNQSSGTTQFTRTYINDQIVSLTAPSTASGNNFQKWLKDGADFANNTLRSLNVTMDADHTMTAVYLTPPKTVQFDLSNYIVSEIVGKATINVTRSGDTTAAATVSYTTSDTAGASPCNSVNTGIASSRCDYETTLGTLKFAAGETSKTVYVPIVDDSYLEGNESLTISLSNPSGGTLGSPSSAMITIVDNETANGTNPINGAEFFTRIHYYDFLNREADTPGLNFWMGQITSCGSDATCTEVRRISVSASFFLSIEFKETGYLVERAYKASYGDVEKDSSYPPPVHKLKVPIIRFQEFLADTQQITEGVVVLAPGWEQKLESNKVAFFADFVQRSRFTTALPTTLTPAQFVDQLNTNAGNVLSTSERATAINLFGGAGNTTNTTARAQALRQVAEDADLAAAEINRAFVLMQYYGYLRRNPDDPPEASLDYAGYEFWLIKLNLFGGDYSNAEMVKAFLSSIEYNRRFGP
jgi:uncharacterized delta-60 repeat protein